jgi:preprotein translocase subunit SecD
MRWILCLAGLLLFCLSPARAGSSPPKILLRIYVQTSGEGLPGTEARQITIPPNNEAIMIRAIPEVTEGDLIAVHADAAGNIHFFFDHQGQINLDAVTAQNQGRILVVTLDGYIIYAPLIDEQISTGELVMPHPLDPKVIQALQETAQHNVEQSHKD